MSEKITMPTKQLKEMIQLSTLTTSKEKDNILSNAVITITNKTIEILSKNTITKSKQTTHIENIETNNTFIINPNILFNILRELKETTTELTIEENTIKIKNGKFKTTIKTINRELYPNETPTEKEFICELNFNKLKHLMKITTPYPDKNDISREYTGIFIEINNNKIKATSTDHFRLINIETNIEETNTNENFIIENEGGALISKIDMNNTVKLYKNKHSIELIDDNKTIESKIIQGEFPNYKVILLNENSNKIILNKDELLSSVKRVAITNTNNEIIMKKNTDNNIINISSINTEGEESTDEIEFKESSTTNELNIKLNAKFLIGFLSQITTEDIQLLYKSSEEPIMITCKDNLYVYNYIMTPITN